MSQPIHVDLPHNLGREEAQRRIAANIHKLQGYIPGGAEVTSDWSRCGAQPFEVPPINEWANVVQTLRYVRDYVVPAVGAVEPVSAYRNPILNQCAGGAAESVHMTMSAMDLVPLAPIDRGTLMSRLCAAHAVIGPRYNVGLGFYAKLRFHVDSWKYRTWGRNDGGSHACFTQPPRPPLTLPVASPALTQAPLADPLAPR